MVSPIIEQYNNFYILFDILWLFIFSIFFIYNNKLLSLLVGFTIGSILVLTDIAFILIFPDSIKISGFSELKFLIYHNLSYGLTIYSVIWVMFYNKNVFEWLLFTVLGWLTVAILNFNFTKNINKYVIMQSSKSIIWLLILSISIGYFILIYLKFSNRNPEINLMLIISHSLIIIISKEIISIIFGIRISFSIISFIRTILPAMAITPYLYLLFKSQQKYSRPKILY